MNVVRLLALVVELVEFETTECLAAQKGSFKSLTKLVLASCKALAQASDLGRRPFTTCRGRAEAAAGGYIFALHRSFSSSRICGVSGRPKLSGEQPDLHCFFQASP